MGDTQTVVRNGKEVELKVPITEYNGQETVEIIGWQGMIIQKAFAAAKEQSQKSLPEGVYVSFCYFGSPAQSTVFPNIWITEIDGVLVKSLEGFMKLVFKDEENIQTSKPSETRTGDIQSLLTELNIEQLNEDSKESRTHVRIKYVGMDGVSHICTLRLDRHYWPTWHIKKDPSIPTGWSLNFL
jgi:hypothetical protein